jgi:PAS domain S-box-containing protein
MLLIQAGQPVFPAWCEGKMKSILNRKIQLAFGSAILTLLVVGLISYRGMEVSSTSDRWVRHTHEVLENLHDLLSSMQNVESSYRGFILTGEDSYLAYYRAGVTSAGQYESTVRNLTLDNATQQNRLPALEALIAQEIRFGNTMIALRQGKGMEAAAESVRAGEGQQIMDDLHALIRQMEGEELRLLVLRDADAARRVHQTNAMLILGTLLGLLITVAAVLSAQRDASRRRLADDEIWAREEQYRTLFDEVQDYAIFMLDPEGTVVSWNAGAERLKGYKADEIIGHNFSCFFVPEDIERGRPAEILRITAASGRHEEQGMRVRKDGSRFVASITFIALRDATGNLRGFYKISRDLSETRESRARYRGLLEAAPDAMVVVNQQAEIVLLNLQAETQFGYSRDELIGQKVTNIIPEGFAERLITDFARTPAEATAQQIGAGMDLIGRRKDGTEFPIEMLLSPLESVEGILVTAAIRDISIRKAAEKKLAEVSRELSVKLRLLDAVVEGTSDFIYIRDLNDHFTFANSACAKLFGRTVSEVVGVSMRDLLPEDSYDAVVRNDRELVRAGGACTIEEVAEIDGARRVFLTTKGPFRDADEKIIGTIGISREITERRKLEEARIEELKRDIAEREAAEKHLARMEGKRRVVEEALRESEERYRMLLDGIRDYAIYVMDSQGRVVSWNSGAERIKGYRADQIIGQSFSCFFPPEDIKRGRPEEILRLTAASGRHEEQGMRVRKDGSRFLASLTFTALRDSDGNLRGFSEFSHDLSESKESGAKYRGLLEAAPDAMVVVNQDGEIVLLNVQAEKQFGYSRDELIGQKVKNIIPEGFAERLIADDLRSTADALAQQIGTGIELTARRKNGSEFPIEIMLSPLKSAQGILVTAAIRDITERNKSEEHLVKTIGELKRSNDELQQFAYVASHDLQEPLRMVASYTQLLAQRYKGRLDSDADEFIGYAVDGSNRMQDLIQDLLAYSRAGTNGKVLREISSENAFKEALANLRTTIGESGAIVTHDLLPAITTDDTQLSQVFQNLVGNAIKYRGAEVPHVHVSAARNGGNEWIFSVRDNGLGIDPQYFEKIFVIFQRLHGREEFKGTGIGLAICKKVVERLGGRIWVESQPQKGSTFYFALPERQME